MRLLGHNHYPEPAGGMPDCVVCSATDTVVKESGLVTDATAAMLPNAYILALPTTTH